MTEYVIETGIPMPEKASLRRGPPPGALTVAMRSMKVGDSILLTEASDYHAARGRLRFYLPMKFAMRKSREGWRVWRVE